jgi:hypothetical protein
MNPESGVSISEGEGAWIEIAVCNEHVIQSI